MKKTIFLLFGFLIWFLFEIGTCYFGPKNTVGIRLRLRFIEDNEIMKVAGSLRLSPPMCVFKRVDQR